MLKSWKVGDTLARHLIGLKIPPAWTNVQVETDPDSPVLATGFDKAGRQQYRYRPDFLAKNQDDKFANVRDLLVEWEDIRTQIERDVNNLNEVGKEHWEAAVIAYLIYETGMRPGSEKDTKAKVKAYGSSTLLAKHILPGKDSVALVFIGKKGVQQNVLVTNPWLVKTLDSVRHGWKNKPDQPIFKCRESVLRKYFKSLGSGKFTPKDFRVAIATKLAIELIGKHSKDVPLEVSKKLGNTKSVAKKSYIDPSLIKKSQ